MKLKYYMRGLGTGIILVVLVYTLTGKNHVMSDLEIMAKARKLGMVEESSSTDNKGILGNNSELSGTPSITQNDDLNSQQKDKNSKQEEDSKITPLPELTLEPTMESSNISSTPIPKETEPTNLITPTITPKAKPTKAPTPTAKLKAADNKTTGSKPTSPPKAKPTKTPEKMSTITPTISPIKESNTSSSNKSEGTNIKTETSEKTKGPEKTEAKEETKEQEEIKTAKEPEETKEEYVYLTVTKGMYSKEVAQLAKKKGLVKNAEEFDKYLMDNGYSSRILVNTHKIRLGADYEEIAESLVERKPQADPENSKE